MPAPPEGPEVRRVTHDALGPARAGQRVVARVITDAGASVSAALGPDGKPVVCAPDPAANGAWSCDLVVPPGLAGAYPVVTVVKGRDGRETVRSSILPVIIEGFDPASAINALNARLKPVFFDPRSAALDGTAQSALEANLPILSGEDRYPIIVEGHCDFREGENPAGLSRQRAEAVFDALVQLGIPKSRITATGFGDGQPLVRGEPGAEPPAHPLNRRAMIIFGLPAESSAR